MWRTSSPSAASRSPTSPFGSGVVRSVTPTRDGSDSGAAGWATRGHLDELRSYAAARQTVMPSAVHCTDQYANNRAEVSHQSTAARAVDAPLQVTRPSATLCVGPQRSAQSLLGGPTPPSISSPPLASQRSVRRVGGGDVCPLTDGEYICNRGTRLSSIDQLDNAPASSTWRDGHL